MSKSSDGPSTSARRGVRTRHVLIAAGILTLGIAPFGVAATGDALREGKRNGTTRAETQIISNINSSTKTTGGYATRQSNLSTSGGGAIYGCRSGAGSSNSNPPRNPCVRANNLSNGQAFEFQSGNGAVVGSITAGAGGDTKKPFTTNATGVATGLNADRLDGLDGAQIQAAIAAAIKAGEDRANAAKSRFVTVAENADGTGAVITAQSGGFSLVNCYQANDNCYIDAGGDITNRSLVSEIVTENGANDAGTDGQLTGDTSASPCASATVACAPPGTEDNKVFVVTPRNSDGTAAAANDRYTFTVQMAAAG